MKIEENVKDELDSYYKDKDFEIKIATWLGIVAIGIGTVILLTHLILK